MSRFRHRVQSGRSSKPLTAAGLVSSTLFGLVFAGFAVVMGAIVLKDHRADQAMLAWEPVPCTIVKSSIETVGEGEYSFSAEYTYERGGRAYSGYRYSRNSDAFVFDKVSEKAPLLKRYPVGIVAMCYVNPENTADSVLVRGDGGFPWSMLLFLVPFVVVGLGIVFGPWIAWARRRRASGFESPTRKNEASKRGGRFIMMIFGLMFVGAGAGVGYATLPSLTQWRASSGWTEVPAVVTASAVRSSRGDDSTTYRPYIAYVYTVDGREYEGDRYDFWSVSSSGYEGKAAIVREHPVGREIRVYVDPADPALSVIKREAGWGILFPTLFPLIFMVVGCSVFVAGARMGRDAAPARANGFARDESSRTRGEPIRKASRGRVVGSVLFALVWNGIVSVFVFQAWRTVEAGRPEWILIAFLIPFVIIGLGALVGVVAEILRLFNPRIEIASEGGDLCLDRPLRLRYRSHGSVHRIAHLRISLHGVEKATYSQGKSRSTSEHEFYGAVLLETSDPREMVQGRLEAELPADAMHSFQSENAAIEWRLKVEGMVSLWPDIKDEHRLHVQPSERRFA